MDKVALDDIIFIPVVSERPISIYKILIGIEVMNTVVIIFFSGSIAMKGAKYIYFIRYKVVVVIFKFIINIGNYKAEVINPKINNITINNVIFETALS